MPFPAYAQNQELHDTIGLAYHVNKIPDLKGNSRKVIEDRGVYQWLI